MKKETAHSRKRLSQALLEEINSALRNELADPKIQFVTVTGVELNKDNSVAHVHWDTFRTEEVETIKVNLEVVTPRLRALLAKKLQMRHTPELRLVYNSQFEDALKIDRLLKENNDDT
ncbi:MAG: 30S ribosome-binding factor RbfA [Bacteriovoracaceae bacterium]|nr:30S ribosome-binding factor RbfA [Bacteriovoracaceae bacterium]